MKNIFTLKMVSKTDRELQRIVEKKDQFQKEAVIAALEELEKRMNISDSQVMLKEELESELKVENEIKIKTGDEDLGLISKSWIGILGFLFSPLIGTLFFDINLWRVRRRNEIWIVSALTIIYTFLGFMLMVLHPLLVIVINGVGAYILTGPLWDKLIEEKQKLE